MSYHILSYKYGKTVSLKHRSSYP